MRISVDIDNTLMQQALASGNYKTKKSAIEHGLTLLVQVAAQKKLCVLKGKIHWDGDLEFARSSDTDENDQFETVELSNAQKKLLDERLSAFRKNPKQGTTWGKVKERIQRSRKKVKK